nr:hypothetical protein [Actinomadura madurae]
MYFFVPQYSALSGWGATAVTEAAPSVGRSLFCSQSRSPFTSPYSIRTGSAGRNICSTTGLAELIRCTAACGVVDTAKPAPGRYDETCAPRPVLMCSIRATLFTHAPACTFSQSRWARLARTPGLA